MVTILAVEGMTCGNCARHVENALTAVSGVTDAAVDLAGKRAEVSHGDDTTVDALIEAVVEEGYRADVVV
jgi:copper chaperone CopZ